MGAVAVAVRERRVRARVDAVLIALGALVVLAAVLRFTTLSDQSYWLDESVTALRSNGSFYHMLAAFHRPGGEAQPPLYFVLAWFWARVFGTDEFGLRSLSAVCGVLTVPVARRHENFSLRYMHAFLIGPFASLSMSARFKRGSPSPRLRARR